MTQPAIRAVPDYRKRPRSVMASLRAGSWNAISELLVMRQLLEDEAIASIGALDFEVDPREAAKLVNAAREELDFWTNASISEQVLTHERFHLTLAALSGRRVLVIELESVFADLRGHFLEEFVHRSPSDQLQVIAEHRVLLEKAISQL